MINIKKIAALILFSLIVQTASPLFAENEDTTPAPYKDDEFPQGLKDLRRFEIITLGSLPFVTLDTTLTYSTIRYIQHDYDAEYKPNIFSKSSFSTDEQKGIILTSIGISVGIGLTDYIVQLVKRNNKKKKEKNINYDDINIIPIAEDPDAIRLDTAINSDNNSEESSLDEVDIINETVIIEDVE